MKPLVSAWASFTLGNATELDVDAVIGKLTTAAAMAGFDSQWADQTVAWREQLQLIQQTARESTRRFPGSAAWTLLLEYPIPRRGKRIDAVLLAANFVIVLEFKIGKSVFDRSDLWQTEDYVLDLRDFHEASRGVPIEGVLVATAANSPTSGRGIDAASRIYKAK
jgi:hypothetical protein